MCLMFCIDHQLAYFMTGIIVNRRLGTGGWSVAVVTTHDGGIITSALCSCSSQLSKQLGSLIPSRDHDDNVYVCCDQAEVRRHTRCWQRTMAVTRRVISLLICNHIPVNTNLSPVPAYHTNDIRHSSTFPKGPGSDYFLILDATPPMSNWPTILRVVTRMQGGCWGREDFPICINLPSISSQHGGWRMNLTWPCLNL